ncbi:TetR/AcrR family transcriptional regulator [Polymorphum gilvum]|uniref:Transcriptional regulator, TetR family protein n=1 Tax=Polymorphum gilvum (strain LMG 25793 / CGMCC 1.9160 / SL003B-26A1) TaxID=991905 RepID=F2IZY4_POLGS|nr:TetR/AcrR family transcriptional regulator [Polymorphum gilvum]ADZ70710.1 Transcriptional regulator, TetR family protein [Polymorphum gilvum SL003B-26A1]
MVTDRAARDSLPAAAAESEAKTDNAKRRQILDGARTVFRARGFDGASMETIARQAGVSKGTLYVYFDSKEALFRALILEERMEQPETCLELAGCPGDIAADLKRIGTAYLEKMSMPERISTLRMVVGAVEQFPEFGALLDAEGPRRGIENLGAFLQARIARGDLKPCDTEVAASHFFGLCTARALRRVLFNVGSVPSEDEIRSTVEAAVAVFLAAYGGEPCREGKG